MSYALVSGTLFRKPEEKISKAGKPYAVATIKSGFGEACEFWRIIAFSDAAASALLELEEGDALSAAGLLQVSVWAPEGREPKANLAIVADQIISARAAKSAAARARSEGRRGGSERRQERKKAEQAANGGLRHYGGEAHSELNDSVPW